jgi:hypothetical protein
MYFHEINKLIIFFLMFFEVYFCCQLLWVNSYFIFHNNQSLPIESYMLNVYVLIGFQLGLLYALVATR